MKFKTISLEIKLFLLDIFWQKTSTSVQEKFLIERKVQWELCKSWRRAWRRLVSQRWTDSRRRNWGRWKKQWYVGISDSVSYRHRHWQLTSKVFKKRSLAQLPEKHPALLNAHSRFEELNSAYVEVLPITLPGFFLLIIFHCSGALGLGIGWREH